MPVDGLAVAENNATRVSGRFSTARGFVYGALLFGSAMRESVAWELATW